MTKNEANEVKNEDYGGHEADTTGVSCEEELLSFEVSPSEEDCRKVVRFLHVVGHEGRANDVIYGRPMAKEYLTNGVESSTSDEDQTKVMVFFGGDIQVGQRMRHKFTQVL
jgi:hypothetical protein